MEGYQVQTNFFEGPLDLLLHLIRKNKFNILDVRLSEITSEYLEYLEKKIGINPSREGDFLITAATLIYIKSRSLLPKQEVMETETAEKKLLFSLVEYEKIQKISKMLKEMEETELVLWRRKAVTENFETKEFVLEEVSAFQLSEIFFDIIKKKEEQETLTISSKNYSLEEKQREILGLLDKDGCMDFTEYIKKMKSLEEIVVTFFSLLEMIKQSVIIALQKRLFGKISIWKTNHATSGQ